MCECAACGQVHLCNCILKLVVSANRENKREAV